jgi:hypothetical protein
MFILWDPPLSLSMSDLKMRELKLVYIRILKEEMKIPEFQLLRFYSRAFGAQLLCQEKSFSFSLLS